MVNEYKTIRTSSPSDLEQQVNLAIIKEWEPVGGVAVAINPRSGCEADNILFVQALVK